MYGSTRATPSTTRARPATATPSTSTSPTSPAATTARALVEEDDKHVVFEFQTPYHHRRDAAQRQAVGHLRRGRQERPGAARQGRLRRRPSRPIAAGPGSDCGAFRDGLDLTDHVKGRRQYLLALHAGPTKALAKSGLTMTTVCQANAAVLPRLKDNGSEVRFEASGRAVSSAGPNRPQAQAHVVEGKFGSRRGSRWS